MNKPRLFIAAHYLEIGGAEISLIGLLQSIDYSRFEVDLFLYQHTGDLMALIPSEVNLLSVEPAYTQIECSLRQTLFSRYWRIAFARLKTKFQYRIFAKTHECPDGNAYYQFLADNVTPLLPSLYKYGEYDLAINFIGIQNIIRDKVKAKKKVAWVHTDYTSISVYPELELPVWDSADIIATISEASRDSFLKVFPSLSNKTIVIENILSSSFVRARAEMGSAEGMEKTPNDIVLLSIGRFCVAKNYDNVPDICKRLLSNISTIDSSLSIKWYIIGYGSDEDLIREKIAESGMEEHVIILGKKENPYPYIKACDWYVQPSRYEGKSVTVREAQMLCKPVIIANYTTAKSQVRDGIDGVIVPQENKLCAEAITKAIIHDKLRQEIVLFLQNHDYGNIDAIDKIYKMFD